MADAVVVPVDDSPGVVPATEDGVDRAHELFPRVPRRLVSGGAGDDGFEVIHHRFQLVCGEFVVQVHAGPRLVFREAFLEGLGRHVHHDVGVNLDEPAIGVVGGSGVVHH